MHCTRLATALWLSLLFTVVSAVVDSPSVAADHATRPNVLFIAVDDLNDWVGVLGGHPQAQTPNIDRLAERGVLFTRAYCSAPGCNASCTSLLMGQRPSTTGVYNNGDDWRQAPALENAVTLPRHFKDNGYRTYGAGKLFHCHTFFSKRNTRGYFDRDAWHRYFPDFTRQMPDEVTPERKPVSGSKRFYRGHFDWSPLEIPTAHMADARVVRWAIQHLKRRHPRPLFLSVGIYRPHLPWYVPQEYFGRFPLEEIQLLPTIPQDLNDVPAAGIAMAKRKWHEWVVENDKWRSAVQAYLASMSFADDMVGQLLDALAAGPLANNTIIVFWSDHGYHLGEKESWEKFALWETTTHVPLIVVAPGVTPPNTRHESTVSLLDLYPTLIDLCGLPNPRQALEGRSLLPCLKQPRRATDRRVVSTQGKGNHAVRSDRYRYILYADGAEELYDHAIDPHEWLNLAGDPQLQSAKANLAESLPSSDAEPVRSD